MKEVMPVAGLPLVVLAVLAVAAPEALGQKRAEERAVSTTVVCVCEHGNVKSLIASEWFNRLAADHGVAARAVSRGLTPETPVPAAIVEKLSRDGFDVGRFEPRALVPADVDGSSRVVLIGVEPPSWVGRAGLSVDKWDGIPPASESYEASRDAMRSRIVQLLEALTSRGPAR